MKIKLKQKNNNYSWYYSNTDVLRYTQKQYDYAFKYLSFDKIEKSCYVHFNKYKTKTWFRTTFVNSEWLCADEIQEESSEGYQWLEESFSKGIYKLYIYYSNKQEFKTIVNKVINIELKRIE